MRPWLERLRIEVVRLAGLLGGWESPWDRMAMPVPVAAFGPGSRCQFAEYFEGESGVRVATIDDIIDWLRTCEYVSDAEQFHERDLWQHPRAFEQSRRGDCEDFALWSWRKLAEIGVDAELFVGCVVCPDGPNRQHAWVMYRVGDDSFLFEPAARNREQMIRPLAEVMDRYVPYFAVNHRLDTFAFAGCVLAAGREPLHRREPARATP